MALTDNLVSYWKLDEASGNAADSVGSNTAVNTGTATYGAAIINNGVILNGSSQYLTVTDHASLDFTTAFSASMWFKVTTMAADKALLVKWTYQTQGSWAIQTGIDAADEIGIFIATSLTDNGNGCHLTTDAANLSSDTWYHLVVVYDGSQTGDANRLKIYVNASSKAFTVDAGAVPASLQNSSAPVNMGFFGGVLTRHLGGSMDEVGLWSRALTSDEVTTLYNSGAGLQYPFSSGSATVIPIPQLLTLGVG